MLAFILILFTIAYGTDALNNDSNETASDVVRGRLLDYMKALEDEDLDEASMLFCEDATINPPSTKPIDGREGILEFLHNLSKNGKYTMEYPHLDSIQAEYLSEDSIASMTEFYIIQGGQKSSLSKAMEVYKNEPDGWCIYRAEYNNY